MKNYKELLKNVTTFIFDYDGVMTQGDIIMLPNGEALRMTNVKDGFALQLAVRLGYNVAVISGGYADSMVQRMKALGVKDVFMHIPNKIIKLEEYMRDKNLKKEEVVYMGDDMPDYPVMQMVGVPVCPADASEEIKQISVYISHKDGGKGAVRDIIEQVMKVQDKWMKDFENHLW